MLPVLWNRISRIFQLSVLVPFQEQLCWGKGVGVIVPILNRSHAVFLAQESEGALQVPEKEASFGRALRPLCQCRLENGIQYGSLRGSSG